MDSMTPAIRDASQLVWDYHLLRHELEVADLIFVLGSHDLRVAERAADLYQQGLASRILMSGGFGNFTQGTFTRPEAELFAEVAIARGVPREHVLVENRSTNTGENVTFSRQLLSASKINVNSVIAVQKPYMERRTFATIRQQWPEVAVTVTSPQLTFTKYCSSEFPVEQVIAIMVGDLHRIQTYPARGFQIPQEIPNSVLAAAQFLIDQGFDGTPSVVVSECIGMTSGVLLESGSLSTGSDSCD